MKKKLALLLVAALALTAMLGIVPIASAEEEIPAATSAPEIEYFNISFKMGATLLFAVPLDGFTTNPDGTVDNLKVHVTKDGVSNGIGGASEGELIESSGKLDIGDKTYLIFSYSGLAAKEMNDIVYARTVFIDSNGFYNYGEAKSCSLIEFVKRYETENQKINELIDLLLAYGDAAIAYSANEGCKSNFLPSEAKSDEVYTIKVKRVVNGVAIDDGFEINQFAKAGEITLSVPPVYGASVSSWEGADVVDGKVTVSGDLELTANYTTTAAELYYSIDQSAATVGAYTGIGGASTDKPAGSFITGTLFGASDAHDYSYCNFTVVEEDGIKCLKFAHNGAGQHNLGIATVGEKGCFVGKGLGDTADFSLEIKVKAKSDGTFPFTSFRIDRTGDLKGNEKNDGGAGDILFLTENGDIILKDLNGNDVVLGKGDATKFQTITVVCKAAEKKYIGYIDGEMKGETTANFNAPYFYASHAANINSRFRICMYGGFNAYNWTTVTGFPTELVGEDKFFNFTESENGKYILDKNTGLYRVYGLNDEAEYKDAARYTLSYTASAELQKAVIEYVDANQYFYFAGANVYIGDIMAK